MIILAEIRHSCGEGIGLKEGINAVLWACRESCFRTRGPALALELGQTVCRVAAKG